MTMLARHRQFGFCCGVAEIGEFRTGTVTSYDSSLNESLLHSRDKVFKIATFINRPTQRQAYEEMCRRLKLVAQTEPKRNPNSGNLVFVAVFTNK